MTTVIRCALVYLFVLLLMRLSGKRTMAEITPFDLVLLLIISETTQQALIGDDFSLTNCLIGATTLVMLDIFVSLLKQRSAMLEKVIDDVPLILLENGRVFQDRLDRCRVDEQDILAAARERQGLERLDQIKYAVLECSGGISIVPREAE